MALLLGARDLSAYIEKAKRYLPRNFWKKMNAARNLRDGKHYHITAIEPEEFHHCMRRLTKKRFRIRLIGLGTAKDRGSVSVFIVIRSSDIHQIRRLFGLKSKDLHITLGFFPRDVHAVKKDQSTLLSNPETHANLENRETGS